MGVNIYETAVIQVRFPCNVSPALPLNCLAMARLFDLTWCGAGSEADWPIASIHRVLTER